MRQGKNITSLSVSIPLLDMGAGGKTGVFPIHGLVFIVNPVSD